MLALRKVRLLLTLEFRDEGRGPFIPTEEITGEVGRLLGPMTPGGVFLPCGAACLVISPAESLGITDYGFRWGPLEVQRAASGKFGWVLRIMTKKEAIQVRASKSGRKLEAKKE